MITVSTNVVIPAGDYLSYITGGNSLVTAKSQRTGRHFTFKIKCPKDKKPEDTTILFVSVLTGPDNNHAYTYCGFLKKDHGTWYYRPGSKRVSPDALSNRVFSFITRLATRGMSHPEMIMWHHGQCRRCGRTLTTEWAKEGIGPECSKYSK